MCVVHGSRVRQISSSILSSFMSNHPHLSQVHLGPLLLHQPLCAIPPLILNPRPAHSPARPRGVSNDRQPLLAGNYPRNNTAGRQESTLVVKIQQ
jgi:hypothetical protein